MLGSGRRSPLSCANPTRSVLVCSCRTFNSGDDEAGYLDRLLHFVRFYHSRSFRLGALKRSGSESSHHTRLSDRGDNAWSVLRNVQDKRNVDARYNTIMGYMAEAFPVFDDIVLEQTGHRLSMRAFWRRGEVKRYLHPESRTAYFSSSSSRSVVLRRRPRGGTFVRRARGVATSLGNIGIGASNQVRCRPMGKADFRRNPFACPDQPV